MDLLTRLQMIAEAYPEGVGAVVALPADWLRGELAAAREAGEDRGDLTVAEVARAARRSPSTVREWIRAGSLAAYLFNAKEYRVTRKAFEDFLDARRAGNRAATTRQKEYDTGRWRKLRAS